MEKLNVYFYSLIDARDWTLHCGMTTSADRQKVYDDILKNYFEPSYVAVRRVYDMEPILNDHGDVTGYAKKTGS